MDFRVEAELNPRLVELERLVALDNPDMVTLTRRLDDLFIGNRRAIFSTRGASGPDGRWTSLSAKYAKWKRRVRPGKPIMQFDGNLKRSLTTKGADHVAKWARVPVPMVTLGTKDIKAAYHGPKAGNPLANSRVPTRDVMAHSDRDYKSYRDAVIEYFQKVKMPRVLRVLQAAGRARRARGA